MAPWGPPAAAAAAATWALLPRRTTRLPNGLRVRYASKLDVSFLYQEVWERQCYLRHGLTLPPGGTVLDVGANIGFFTLFAAQLVGPQGLVVACEPLPPIFECLQHNAAAHEQWLQQQAGRAPPAPILALNVGVGDGSAASSDFTYYSRASGWSAMQPASREQMQDDMDTFFDTALRSREAAAAAGLGSVTGTLGCWLRHAAPSWLFAAAARVAVDVMLGGARRYTCPLLSVQQLVRGQAGLAAAGSEQAQHQQGQGQGQGQGQAQGQWNGQQQQQQQAKLLGQLASRGIDFLKVDVERAELDVLRGVGDCWPLVRQAALEVHEANLEAVLQLLHNEAGFRAAEVVVEQDEALAGTSVYAVYCRRS